MLFANCLKPKMPQSVRAWRAKSMWDRIEKRLTEIEDCIHSIRFLLLINIFLIGLCAAWIRTLIIA